MEYELTIYELGKLLEEIDERFEMLLLTKAKLSGGWLTIQGKVNVDYVPSEKVMSKGNNIINLKLNNENGYGSDIKITGLKETRFMVVLAAAKYKQINKGGINLDQIKEKEDQCTLKIDENMVFTIKAPLSEVSALLEKK